MRAPEHRSTDEQRSLRTSNFGAETKQEAAKSDFLRDCSAQRKHEPMAELIERTQAFLVIRTDQPKNTHHDGKQLTLSALIKA